MIALLLLAQTPAAFEVALEGGAAGYPGGPIAIEITEGPELSAAELEAVKRAMARDDRGGERFALDVAPLVDANGDSYGVILECIAPAVPANATSRIYLAVGDAAIPAPPDVFTTVDEDEGSARARVLVAGGERLLGYVHGYDAEHHAETFRVYHHLGAPSVDGWITKGPGGKYPHHRGLFVGWRRVLVGDRAHDLWTIDERGKPRQVHESFDDPAFGAWSATQTTRIAWIGGGNLPVATESRTVRTWRPTNGITTHDVDVRLDPRVTTRFQGDPAHAGVHVRLAEGVIEEGGSARYLLPEDATEHAHDKETFVARWAAARFECGDRSFALLHLSSPQDGGVPAYNTRGYGRFGSFREHRVEKDATLHLRHRLHLIDEAIAGELTVERSEAFWQSWNEPPTITIRRLR